MSLANPQTQQSDKDKQTADKPIRDAQREETNKTDPQLTELKGFFNSKEPLEEEGTLNPLTGNKQENKE
jgi:Zn/Cd-binding protein ZinT